MEARAAREPKAYNTPIQRTDSNCEPRSLMMRRGSPCRATTISRKYWTVSDAEGFAGQLRRCTWRVNLSVTTTIAVCLVYLAGASPHRKSMVTTSQGCRAKIVWTLRRSEGLSLAR